MKTKGAEKSPGTKTGQLVILFSLVLFIILILVSFVWFSRTGILSVFRGKWVLFKALSNFLQFYPAFFCSAILLLLALAPQIITNSNRSFSSFASFFIIFMMLYTGLREIGNPRIQKQLTDIQYLTQSGEDLIKAAYAAELDNDLERTYQNMKRYQEIDPKNERLAKEFDRIKKEYAAEQFEMQEQENEKEDNLPENESNSAESLTELAAEFLLQQEYQSAYYHATIAAQLGSKQAEEIQKAAWDKISTVTPGKESEANSLLFTQKSEGQSSLSYGNVIEAYYLFLDLQTSYPGDSEIKNLLEETEEKLSEKAFFLDEVIQALSYPGYSDIYFIQSKNEKATELFYAKTVIPTQDGIFFKDIEVLSMSSSTGTILEHYYAPYAKSVGKTLLMQCIHRTDSKIQFRPRFIVSSEQKTPPKHIALPLELNEFQYFSQGKHDTKLLSFGDLINLRKLWPVHGYRTEPIYIELLMRIMYPFSFLVFAFFSLSIGIRTKLPSNKISVSGYLLIPFLPFLLYFIIQFFYYINRIFLTFVYSWLGFPIALMVLFLIQGGLLVFSIAQAFKRVSLV